MLIISTILVLPNKAYYLENLSLLILRCIYSLEILLTLVVIFTGENMFPGSSFNDKKNIHYDIKKNDLGVRLLQYSIFGNILHIIPTLILIIYAINSTYHNPSYGHTAISTLLWFFYYTLQCFY